MTEGIGRRGFLALAIEAIPGTPEASPDIIVPFLECTLRGYHEPLADMAAHTSRVADFSSVQGKKWGEGDVKMYLDSINAGYLIKMAFGQEARTQKNATPPVHDHLMYPTVSGNAPTTATLWVNRLVDTEQYAYAAVDNAELEITNEGIATITASIMSKFPTTGVTAPTLSVPSGTLYTWKDMTARFGSTVAAAKAASATKLTNFKLAISNNVELTYKSGSNSVDTAVMKEVQVSGEFSLYFENSTDRDAYYNLTKRSMVVTLAGASLGSGYAEQLEIVLKKIRLADINMETGLDDLFAIRGNYVAEWDQDQAGYVEATVRNGKATDYT